MAQAAAPRSNNYPKDKLKECIQRCEEIDKQIASETGTFMKKIQDLKSDRKTVLDEYKEEGIPTKPIRAILKRRKLLRDLDKVEDNLDGEDAETFQAIMDTLGEWTDEVAPRQAA